MTFWRFLAITKLKKIELLFFELKLRFFFRESLNPFSFWRKCFFSELSKWIQTIFAPHTEINWNQQSNKTLFFWSHLIPKKVKVYDLTHICFSCRITCGNKLRFSLVSAKIPNYLLWEIYAYRTIHMGLRRRYIFGNSIVKWIFLVFWSRDLEFLDQSTKYLHFSNSVKPDQT